MTNINNLLIKFDARIDKNSFKKKETNVSVNTNYPTNISLNYHETQKNAFSEKSKDTDDCSALSLEYSNKRYNDNYNTSPEEIFSINFRMDYLGFFGYEESTDLLNDNSEKTN